MSEIPCPIAAAARRWPEAPALIGPDGPQTYAALDASVAALAGGLARAGVQCGDRVGLLMEPGPQLIALLFALARLGAIACPVSLRLPPERVGPTLTAIGAAGLITDRPVPGPVPRLIEPRGEPPLGPATPMPSGQPVTAVFTSGSSGLPKAVLHSAGNHWFSAQGALAALPMAQGDRWLLSLPLYHVGGLGVLWRCFIAGAAVALPDPGEPLGDSLARLGITHLSVVPTQLRRLLREGVPAAPLKAVLSGGDATPPALLAEAAEAGLPVHASYGCTEAAALVTLSSAAKPDVLPTGSGRVLAHRRLRIGPEGEIEIGGATLALGYLDAGGLRPLADAAGWFGTGDLGRLDADGTLHVAGRRDRRFVSGGENVHPEAVEQALASLPGVAQAAVVAVADAEFGHRPVAFLRLDEGSSPDTPEALTRVRAALDARGLLPRFMHPARLLAWPEEPGGPAMKPDRRLLERLAAEPPQESLRHSSH
jgi:O-succinylbenzoic acid--CoA ligase